MPLSPILRLIQLDTAPDTSPDLDIIEDATLATTTNITDFGFSSELDKVGNFSASVPAGDPGDGSSLAFAEAFLKACQDIHAGTSPVPLLVSLSLDNGVSYDSHRLVRNPERSLNINSRVITEAGSDTGDALALAVIPRATYTQVSLDDALNGVSGAITTTSAGGIRATAAPIPYLGGILNTHLPAEGMGWHADLAALLAFSATINPLVSGIETNVDCDSTTVLAALQTICNRLAGSYSDSYHGHFVIDPSDSALNLTSSVDFVATAVSNAVIVGHYPSSEIHITFDATNSIDVTEATTARVLLNQATVQSDDNSLYKSANMVGGKNLVGIPENSKINGLCILNGTSATMSGGSQWYDAVLIVGLSFNDDTGGGLYFLHQDNILTPIPGSPGRPVYVLSFDEGASGRPKGLLLGSTHGVWYSTDVSSTNFVTDPVTTWVHLGVGDPGGPLNAKVLGMQVQNDPDNSDRPTVFALVEGGKDNEKSIYRYANLGGTWKWETVLTNQLIGDFCTTDFQTLFLNKTNKEYPDVLYMFHIESTGEAIQRLAKQLPHASGWKANIRSVHRVVTVAHDSQGAHDSVWVLCDGDQSTPHPSPAYYLLNDGSGGVNGGWDVSFTSANPDGSITTSSGQTALAHHVLGPGVTFDPGVPGPTVNAILSTNEGALWTDLELGTSLAWKPVALAGLDNYPLEQIATSEAIYNQGVHVNPMYGVSGNDILVSNSSGRYFSPLVGRDRSTVAPYLSQLSLVSGRPGGAGPPAPLGDLPSRAIVTWGSYNSDGTPMYLSPLSLPDSTHVYIDPALVLSPDDAIPRGLYWHRFQDDHQDFQYELVSQTTHLPGIQMSQLGELQTNSVVSATQTAKGIATVAKRFLGQHAQPVLHLQIQSSFDDPLSALRTLRATHKVQLIGSIAIKDISSTGAVLTTHVMNFDGTEDLWVISHQIKKGPGLSAMTTTVLSNRLLETPPTPEDMANSLQDSIHKIKTWGTR